MRRKDFLKILSTTPFIFSMDAFSYLAGSTPGHQSKNLNSEEFASFGVVHLNNTSLVKAIDFWTNVIGLELRSSTNEMAEFGTVNQSLVVVHQSATKPFQEGFSGLYHFAIHLPDKHAFAKSLYRLQEQNQAFSPVDHTMTQSLYLNDPDGITIELALETPERFKRVITKGGLKMEDTDGTIRAASAPLDIDTTLRHLNNRNLNQTIHKDSKVGHVHFYANDVVKSNAFYKKLGFYEFNYLPQYEYADLGAGGIYQHRVAMNSWHGSNRPLAPANSAGLRHYQIIFKSKESLNYLIPQLSNCEKINDGYKLSDPTGNIVHLSYAGNQ